MQKKAGEFGDAAMLEKVAGRPLPTEQPQEDIVRTTLIVLAIFLMVAASLWVVSPFIAPAIWALSVVVPTWTLMLSVQARLGNSRALATLAMMLLLLLVFFIPLWLATTIIVEQSDAILGWAAALPSMTLPAPPQWLVDLPIVGERMVSLWQKAEGREFSGLLQRLTPHLGAITRWAVAAFGGLGVVFVQFLLAAIFAALMYARGEVAVALLFRFARCLGGTQAEQSVILAGQAIRGVVMGIVVTAFVQSAIGGVGLALVGVPLAALLCAVMFMLCIAQIGPAPIMLPAAIWMFVLGDTLSAAFLFFFCFLAIGVDNVLRPILIRRAADLPLLLIFVGVVGGLVAFGLVGLVIGPVVLAVAYKLLLAWVAEDHES